MSDVFISYANEDRERAHMLAGALEAHGWSVWWDRKILAGQTFDKMIESELETAGAIVVLWSKTSIVSEWVRNEATVGAERGVLVPALIDAVKLPLEFRRKQTADLTRWDGDPSHEGFQALCRGLAATLRVRVAPPRYTIPAVRPALRGRGYRKRVLVAAVIVALGLAASWGFERLRGKTGQAPGREAANQAFIEAAHKGQVDTLSKLLGRGADLQAVGTRGLREAADSRYYGAQSIAGEQEQLDTLAFLLQRGVDVNTRNEDGMTPLMLAARSEFDAPAALKLLLEKGADVHAKCSCSQCDPRSGSQGCTALMIAASRGHRDSVQALLGKAARVDEATDAKRTALMLTTDGPVIRALLQKGAAADLRDAEGKTALMWAIEDPRTDTDAVRALIESSANLDVQDDSGRTALTWAAAGGRAEIVRLLIARHVALNPKTVNGRTPLMLAARNGHTAVVRYLARQGAKLNERDTSGKTALQLAREQLAGQTRDEMVHLLKRAGAK
jgi:ankyrin repeat protein